MTFNAARQPFFLSATVSVTLAVLFAVRHAIAPGPVELPFTDGMPVAAALTRFSTAHPRLAMAAASVILLWIVFVIVRMTVRYSSATNRNYLPFQFFVITACGIVISGEALASFAAAWLLVLSTKHSIDSFRKNFRFEDAFRAGFFLGTIPLLYAPGVLLLPLIPIVRSLYRRSPRELAVGSVGALLPVPAAGFLYWAFGEDSSFIYRELWRCLSERPAVQWPGQIPVTALAVAALVIAITVAAVAWFLAHRKGMRTRQRKIMGHVSFMLLLILASMSIPGASPSVVPLLATGVAMAVPYAFFGKQALAWSIVYCVVLAAVLVLDLAPVLGVSIP